MKRLLFKLAAAQAARRNTFHPPAEDFCPDPPVIFRDDQSHENYLAALESKPLQNGVINPLLVISGPPASGKTQLAIHFASAHGSDPVFSHGRSEKLLDHELQQVLRYKIPVMVFDNISNCCTPLFESGRLLRCFDGAPMPFRMLGDQKEHMGIPPKIVMTCPLGTTFPAALVRRLRLVELAEPVRSAA